MVFGVDLEWIREGLSTFEHLWIFWSGAVPSRTVCEAVNRGFAADSDAEPSVFRL